MLEAFIDELAAKGSVTFAVRARPSAPTTKAVEKLDDESIKIAIAAPPEKGKANAELIKFLSKEFAVSKSQITIVSGATAPHKLIRITT